VESACGFFGAALAELLRTFTDFDGALFHTECRARGATVCRWTSTARGE
jgi:predicted hydrocarbon binding protein